MKKLLGLLMCLLALHAYAQEVDTFTISNPYPFSECTYQVTAFVQVNDNRGSLSEPLTPQSVIIHPGSKKDILVEIPEGKSFFSVSYTVEAFGSGTTHRDLGNQFEARKDGCLTTKDAHTFWNPISPTSFEIWEAIVTQTTYIKEEE